MFDKKILDSTEFYQHRFNNFATLAIIPVALLFIIFTLFLIVARREITVMTTGEIAPSGPRVIIQSTSNMRVVYSALKEGKSVRKGQLLLTYHSKQTSIQLRSLQIQKKQLCDQQSALNNLKSSIQNDRDNFTKNDDYGYRQTFKDYLSQKAALKNEEQQISVKQSAENNQIKKSQTLLQDEINRTTDLINDYQMLHSAIVKESTYPTDGKHKGIYNSFLAEIKDLSKNEKLKIKSSYEEQIESQIETAKNNLDGLKLQLSSIERNDISNLQVGQLEERKQSLQAQELKSVDEQVEEVKQQLSNLSAKEITIKDELKDYKIKAPKNGILHLNPKISGYHLIPNGTELTEILPVLSRWNNIKVTMMVPPTMISSIKIGQHVRFKISRDIPVPIILNAEVKSIAAGPTITKIGNLFQVTAVAKLSSKQIKQIHYGMQGQVSIITGEKTYWHYCIDRLFNNE